MTATTALADAAARARALDPHVSFIVQAPAGSGKTELLIQRFLRLLATVEAPEEVVAVTFTRKAAGEMRSRIIAALRQAEGGEPPAEQHLRLSFDLAREVLRDEQRREWQLPRHPARLHISTIDSVNTWLAGRAPIATGGSALQRVAESPELLYREAARATLGHITEAGESGDAVAHLTRHLDNDAARFERLVVAMLPRRDQWLRHVLAVDGDREALEAPLRELTAHALAEAAECLGVELAAELTELLAFAARNLAAGAQPALRTTWGGRAAFPAAQRAELPAWKALAAALLTGKGEWRKAVDKRNGFPPGSGEKARMTALLEGCATRERLRTCLCDILELPNTAYDDAQWEILLSLSMVLRVAAAELRMVFAARGECDFPDVAAAALDALGGDESPSEVALALDHRVRHLLVDEFQDTSQAQFQLLQRLVAGWEEGDGRTVFLVGDPMQSIYRFREAQVGLFMSVRDTGLADLRPQSLSLTVNFRSRPAVVDWINATFSQVFPAHDDAVLGAVRFAPGSPAQAAVAAAGVQVHWLAVGDDDGEAHRVAEIVRAARAEAPEEEICILVRNRAHAARILPALRVAGIHFMGPDLENMERSSAAQDLLALTRALCHPADRLAWIAVLRAPWCGLALRDLDGLLGADHERTVPEVLRDEQALRTLSREGFAAVARLRVVLDRAEACRGRRTLRDRVEGAWLDLSGPATLREAAEIETARSFLALLEAVDVGGDCADPVWLGEQMAKRRGSLGSGDVHVQVMTMHRAKGLEFDIVLLPGLGKDAGSGDSPILAWQDVPLGGGRSAPVLAPMAAIGADGDPLHRYLARLDRRKEAFENDRLLYVACTRARRRLHLFAQIAPARQARPQDPPIRAPRAGSLLRHLWPAIEADAIAALGSLPTVSDPKHDPNVWVQPPLRRLRADWQPPACAAPLQLPAAATMPATSLTYEWASGWAMQVGTVVHHWLKLIAEEGVERYDAGRIEGERPAFRRMLEHLGTAPTDVDRAVSRVADALSATLRDERGRWVLSRDHAEASSELPLTVCDGERFRQLVIDRTFVERSGQRWIVDFKTSTHVGAGAEEFLQREAERHREQLLIYRDALAAMAGGEIRAALYFPLLGAFREVDLGAALV